MEWRHHIKKYVQLDFKQRLSREEANQLDALIVEILGDRVVTPGMVLDGAHAGRPANQDQPQTLRAQVREVGFPTIGDLRGKILLFMMGGAPWFRWDANDTQEKYVGWRGERMQVFACPNASDPRNLAADGHAEDFDHLETNGWVLCGNKKATDDWRLFARTAALDNLLINVWVGEGDHTFDDFDQYADAVRAGASFINKEEFRGWALPMNGKRSCTVEREPGTSD